MDAGGPVQVRVRRSVYSAALPACTGSGSTSTGLVHVERELLGRLGLPLDRDVNLALEVLAQTQDLLGQRILDVALDRPDAEAARRSRR